MDVDFFKLGSGTTIAWQVWVANVEMAISVSKVARGNFCTQETLLLLRTPLHKTSSHLRNKEVHFHTPSMQIGTPTLKQPRNLTPRHSARYSCFSKSPYCYSVLIDLLSPYQNNNLFFPHVSVNPVMQWINPSGRCSRWQLPPLISDLMIKFAPTFTGFIIE